MGTFRVELDDGRVFKIEAEVAPTEEEIFEAIGEGGPQDSGQGYVSSLASSAARGAARIAADIPGGLGYLTGSDTLVQAGEDIEASINEALPVNPIYADDFAMKAANAIGQGVSMIGTAGIGGVAGKALGAVRTGAEVASLGTAFLGGARGGGQEADQYGLEGLNAYTRILGGGAIELATEKFLFGQGDELRGVRTVLQDTVEGGSRPFSLLGGAVDNLGLPPIFSGALTEGGEEFASGVLGNALTAALAPSGVQTPGIFQGGLENFSLGAVAGGTIGGLNQLAGPEPQAPLKPVKAVIDGQVVMRLADEVGTLVKLVDPATNEGLPFKVISPTTEPLLEEKARQLFYETEVAEAPGVNPETFTVDEAAAALLEAAPKNAPTETTTTSSETIPEPAPPPVVETPPAPEVTPLEDGTAAPVAGAVPPPATETDDQKFARIKATNGALRTDDEIAWANTYSKKRAASSTVETPTPQYQGFLETFSPMARAKAKNALETSVIQNGKPRQRFEIIDEMVKEGAVIVEHPKDGRRLQRPNGAFIEERRLTKTGMDYAASLLANPPVAEEAAPPVTETGTAPAPETGTTAAPAPPPPTTRAPDFIGISNRRVDEERVRLGLPTIYEPMKESFKGWWDSAMSVIAARPTAGAELVAEALAAPRPLTGPEAALMAHEHVTRTHAYETALRAYNAATEAQKPAAQARWQEALVRQNEVYEALKLTRSNSGRSLVAYRFMVAMDYSLARMDTELRAANGGKMSAEDSALVQELYSKIAEQQKLIDEYQAVENNQAEQDTLDKLTKEVRAEARKQRTKEEGKPFMKVLEELAAKAEAREKARIAALNNSEETRRGSFIAPDPAGLADRVIIGAYHIAKGLNDFVSWSAAMIQQLGESIRTSLPALFEQSRLFHDQQKAEYEKPAKRKDDRPVMEQVAANAAEGEPLPPRLVYELFREKVEAGVQGLSEIVTQVTNDLRKVYPDITERQVRDEFSGYGRVKFPSQDDIKKRIRALQRVGQITSAIEDAKRLQPPLKSGLQRDPTTPEIRALQKELTKAMKEAGIERITGPQQLKTALDGMKSRLRNEIEELDDQIAQGERRQKSRKAPNVDQELLDLREQRDLRKKILDDLDAPAELTADQLIERAVKAKERTRDELERRIRERDFTDASLETPMTQHLQVLTDEIAALREQYNQMRDEALGSPELTEEQLQARQVAQLNRAIKALEDELAGKVKAPGRTVAPTPEITALQNKLRALREQRKAIKPRTGPTMEQRIKTAEKALEKSIADLTKRIDERDTSTRPQKTGPQTQHLQVLRDSRDSLRKTLNEIKKEQKEAAADPLAAQLKRDKSSLNRRIKKLEERIKNRDFSPPVRKNPVLDEEKIALQAKLNNTQEEWARLIFERRLANRTLPAKLVDAGAQTLNTARAILTSLDVSAVLRQGGFIVLGNPVRGAKNIWPMLQAFKSKEFADREEERLKARENYQIYKRAKLFLSEPNSNKLTQQEEAFMSRWLDKIPTALGGGLLRGSQRAYTVFLNRLRADTFDAMLASLQNGPAPTPAETQAIARYINVATGRGDLGAANQAAVWLNTVFFAPRLVASRFQILGGYPYFKATPRTKRLILREYAKFLTGAALVYALGSLAQDDDDEPIEVDPRSSDFGKIRFGNTRVDPMSGLIQATVLLSRLATGEKKTASGKIVKIRGENVPYGGATSFSVMSDFARSKFSPAFGAGVNLLQGRNVVGESTDVLNEAQRMIVPMSLSDLDKLLKEQGVPAGSALWILSLFGAGVQTYDPTAKR